MIQFSYTNPRCPVSGRALAANPVEQFWSRVLKSDGCWNWTGSVVHGYGQIMFRGKRTKAHRVSWELHHGAIADGQSVLHRCDNPRCVNPGHLFLGTDADNMADKKAKGRQAKGSGHGRAKLSDADVLEIRHLRSHGVTTRDLAAAFRVGKTAIERIVNRQTWGHL